MRIGAVAERSGLSTRMLRHYDRTGVVRPSGRAVNGYREYSDDDLRRIFHVESLRSLGLSLAEAARALDDPAFAPADLVAELARRTEERIADGQELLARLRAVEAATPDAWSDVLRTTRLLRALGSEHAGLRQRVALDRDAPVDALARAYLAEDDTNVAGALRWAIVQDPAAAVPVIAAGLRDDDPVVRRRAVDAAAALAAAPELLATALADTDATVRTRAALALARRGSTVGVPVLVRLVLDGEHDVEAAEALGTLTDTLGPGAAADVVAALVDGASDAVERARVAQALAEIPGGAAGTALAGLARDGDPTVARTATYVRSRRPS
ncbi:MerR family transcriptional regulator [Curtobacterium sp. 22159]|uniref:MerR family transcriptional regulator n=1 Tax=Curtobacterium sp. 22159 TaxID=3453882 RepID=UPI003F83944A